MVRQEDVRYLQGVRGTTDRVPGSLWVVVVVDEEEEPKDECTM